MSAPGGWCGLLFYSVAILAWLLTYRYELFWFSGLFSLSVLDGDVRHLLRLRGFHLVKRLGVGYYAEAWLAYAEDPATVTPAEPAPVVVKLMSGRRPFLQLAIDNSLAAGSSQQCEVARLLRLVNPLWFVNCTAQGALRVAGAWLEFVAYELAPGSPILGILRPAPDAPSQLLGSLAHVLDVVLGIFRVMDEGLRPSGGRGLRYHHLDLHLENVMISDDGQLAVIDYDRVRLCCEIGEECSARVPLCDAASDEHARWTLTRQLARNLLELLCGAELTLPSWMFIKDKWFSVMHWQLRRWLDTSSLPPEWRPPSARVEEAVAQVVGNVHPAYAEEWSLLRAGPGLLTSAFVALRCYDLTWPPRFVELLLKERKLLH